MNVRDLVLVCIHLLGQSVRGRTALQKKCYFFSALSGVSDVFGYRAHYYGPYSSDVASSVNELESLGFLDHSVSTGSSVDGRGFEIARHDYKLTPDGDRIATRKLQELEPETRRRFESAAMAIRGAGEVGYVELSIAAKALHILEENKKPMTTHEICEAAKRFDWEVQPDQVERASVFLGNLDLIDREL